MIRILLVDDQRTVVESLSAWIEPVLNFEIVGTASNGYSAIEKVGTLKPDVVLVDMEMPIIDGIETTRAICQKFIGVKVIILSMHDNHKYISCALQAGATGYLLKNTPKKELIEAITFVNRGYSQFAPGLIGKVVESIHSSRSIDIRDDKPGHSRLAKTFELKDSDRSHSSMRSPSLAKPRGKKFYIKIWLFGNLLIWLGSIAYLLFKPPTYASKWTIALPGTASSTSINLPEIGQASSENQSPFSNLSSDPRENYKLLVESEEVVDAAAVSLNIKPKKFGEPLVKIVDNSTLMELMVKGKTPQESREKATAVHQSLINKLAQLKNTQSTEPDGNTIKTIDNAQLRLTTARDKLAEYRESSGLNSNEQLQILANSIEEMRIEKAQLATQQQRAQGKAARLLQELKLSPESAQDALALHSDRLVGEYLNSHSQIKSELVSITAKYLPSHPDVTAKEQELDSAEAALLERSSSLLGRDVEIETLSQLQLKGSPDQLNSQKEVLLGNLIDLQGEQQGLKQQTEELERQIIQLDARQKQRSRSGSELDRLKKDVQIAEAVYSSTLTRLEINLTDTSNIYPPISLLTKPNLPKKPSSPQVILVLLGSSVGSFFLTTALLSLYLRDRRDREYLYAANKSSNGRVDSKALPDSLKSLEIDLKK